MRGTHGTHKGLWQTPPPPGAQPGHSSTHFSQSMPLGTTGATLLNC